MDTETSEVIERINARIDALEASLRAEIRGESAAVRDDLRAEIRGESAAVRDDLRVEIRGESVSVRDELRAEIRDSLAESKRHAQVLHENVRDDIRMLAEGFAALSARLDSNQR